MSSLVGPGRVVKGAPYSAERVTEMTQSLVDGNRIHHKLTAKEFRDGEGRTRHEEAHGAALPGTGATRGTISLYDPVEGVNWILDPVEKKARKLPAPPLPPPPPTVSGGFAGEFSGRMVVRSLAIDAQPAPVWTPLAGGPGAAQEQESLGKRVIDGMECEGTRYVRVIPEGAIGNERPIRVEGERWFSKELQAMVETRNIDPRTGETRMQLTNIRRGEPDPALFRVPPDYEIVDGPGPVIIDRRIERKRP
ncbi:MAG: hypothetical protein IPM24_13540 [Bryobacterales bacterium]|nr:hypothetical protein [Bryobacterales bacterium]